MSDGSMRSAELWNDGPAFQAALGQMQQFQAQMQRQLQDHMAQIQLQIGSLQQTPQAAYSLAVPAWPPQQVLPQMPLQHVGQAPMPKRTKVRAGRLGRRERAEVKAACATRQAEQKSEGSEAEASGDSWLLEGAAEGSQERQEKKIRAAAMRQLMEALSQVVKAEMEESRRETKEACESMVSAAVQQIDAALARLRTDLKAGVSDTVDAAVEAAVASGKASFEDALGKIESGQASQRAEWELTAKALESKQCSMAAELRGKMEDVMRGLADKLDKLELSLQSPRPDMPTPHAPEEGTRRGPADRTDASKLSLQSPRPDMPSPHAPEEGTHGPADGTDAPELSVQSPTPDMPSLPAPSSEPSPQCHQGLGGAAALALPSGRNAEAGGASRLQDSSAQRDGARRDEADSFDPARKGRFIRLAESDVVASLAAGSPGWSTVCGKHVVAGSGKYEWQLKIEGSRDGGLNDWCMILGVEPAYSDGIVDAYLARKGGFGYSAANGRKIGGAPSSEPYGPPCGAGDVVTVVLDMASCELSFKKNGQDLGVSHRVPPGEYRLAVSMAVWGQSARIVSSGPA